MLKFTDQQISAFEAQETARLKEELCRWMAWIVNNPESLSRTEFDRYWDYVWHSSKTIGATMKNTLFLHGLLVFMHGSDYLDLPILAWLKDIVTDDGDHPPRFELLEDIFPSIVAALKEVYVEPYEVPR